MGRSDQGYDNPPLYVSARPIIGMFPFCQETAGYAFKHVLRLHTEDDVYRNGEGGEV